MFPDRIKGESPHQERTRPSWYVGRFPQSSSDQLGPISFHFFIAVFRLRPGFCPPGRSQADQRLLPSGIGPKVSRSLGTGSRRKKRERIQIRSPASAAHQYRAVGSTGSFCSFLQPREIVQLFHGRHGRSPHPFHAGSNTAPANRGAHSSQVDSIYDQALFFKTQTKLSISKMPPLFYRFHIAPLPPWRN